MKIYVDGACSGNPGPMAIGVVAYDEHGELLVEHAERLGNGTNNEAEYRAVLYGVSLAAFREPSIVYSDSTLVVNQLNGEWQVKDENLKTFYNLIKEILLKKAKYNKRSYSIAIRYIARENNEEADKLAKNLL